MTMLEGIDPAIAGAHPAGKVLPIGVSDAGNGTAKLVTGFSATDPVALAIEPVSAAGGQTTALANTGATQLTSTACKRGFWLQFDAGQSGFAYVGVHGGGVTNAGANAIAAISAGDPPMWFGYANPNLLDVISSAATANLRVRTE